MMKWFYDSLETLQKVDFAGKKDYITLGIGVLVSVVVFGAFFIGVDTLWSSVYKGMYQSLRGADYQFQQQFQQNPELFDGESDLLEGIDLDEIQIEDFWTTDELANDPSFEELE